MLAPGPRERDSIPVRGMRPEGPIGVERGHERRVSAHRDAAKEREAPRDEIDPARIVGGDAQVQVAQHRLGHHAPPCLAEDPLPGPLEWLRPALVRSRERAARQVISGGIQCAAAVAPRAQARPDRQRLAQAAT